MSMSAACRRNGCSLPAVRYSRMAELYTAAVAPTRPEEVARDFRWRWILIFIVLRLAMAMFTVLAVAEAPLVRYCTCQQGTEVLPWRSCSQLSALPFQNLCLLCLQPFLETEWGWHTRSQPQSLWHNPRWISIWRMTNSPAFSWLATFESYVSYRDLECLQDIIVDVGLATICQCMKFVIIHKFWHFNFHPKVQGGDRYQGGQVLMTCQILTSAERNLALTIQEQYGREAGYLEYRFRGNRAQPLLPHKQFLLIFGGKLGRDRRIAKTTVHWKPNIAGPY